jgi:NADH-quinone oxidoreductase subunit M
MNLLDILLLLTFANIGFMYWAGDKSFSGWAGVGSYVIQLLLLITLTASVTDGGLAQTSLGFTIMGTDVVWQMSGLGWFFAVITVGAAIFASWYTAGEWGEQLTNLRLHHTALAANVAAMILLLASGDFSSLFIGWELVSWASFLIMTARGSTSADAAFRYLMYAMSGAMAILVAIGLIYVQIGDLSYQAFWQAVPNMPPALLWSIFLLASAGFLVKLGAMPFHLWQAEAYANTPGANAAFLSAISARMGLFALALVFIQPVVVGQLAELSIPFTFMSAQSLLIWLAALTAIIPTFIALQQSDARLLLAWHGIGQGGFMLMGLAIATPMGIAGGLLHAFNHATYQAALFLAVTAVIHRTGTSDLDRLGGLITKMPWTYITLLMGIIGLAGMPPMNGFVSKWMIYKSLLEFGSPLLMVAASISTLGTILSVYKLIHNIFLGQLRKEHYEVKEVPLTMLVPMLAIAGIAFLTGVMPGLALNMVDVAQQAMGFSLLTHHIGGIPLANGGLNMLWVFGIFMYGLAISAIIFYLLGGRHYHTHQWDNYAGGHFLSADVPFHYSHNFYPGVMRVIGGWFKGWILHTEKFITHAVVALSGASFTLYRLSYTPLLLVVVTVAGLAWITS